MLAFMVTLAMAQSAALVSTPPAADVAAAASTQAAAAPPRKKKCTTNDEPAVGSHIFMDSCHTDKKDPSQGFRDYHAYVTEFRGDKNVPH